jgi:hypothetical protein
LDLIQSARNVLISATKADQATMVATALGGLEPSADCPAGMIRAFPGTNVEWLLSTASAAQLTSALSTTGDIEPPNFRITFCEN